MSRQQEETAAMMEMSVLNDINSTRTGASVLPVQDDQHISRRQRSLTNSSMSMEPAPLTESASHTAPNKRRDEMNGYICMALSALAFAIGSACAKSLSVSGLPSLEIMLMRSIIQFQFGMVGCWIHKCNPLGPKDKRIRRLLVVRGVLGALGIAFYYYAVSVMPLSDATTVFYTSTVFSAIFAHLLLSEPFDSFDRIASVVCMSGIILVIKPTVLFGNAAQHVASSSGNMHQAKGTIAELIDAVLSALVYCIVRKMGDSVNYNVHIIYFSIFSIVGSAAMVWFQTPRMPASTSEVVIIIILGVFTSAGQLFMNRGLQLAPVGPGALVKTLNVVFVFVFGILMFNEIPDWISMLGSVVIIGCTVLMSVHRWLSDP